MLRIKLIRNKFDPPKRLLSNLLIVAEKEASCSFIFSDAVVPTYFYYMTQRTTYKHDAKYNKKENARLMSDICECDHFDDVTYTFGIPLSNAKLTFEVKFTEEEMKYSENWMKFIVNFANTGLVSQHSTHECFVEHFLNGSIEKKYF